MVDLHVAVPQKDLARLLDVTPIYVGQLIKKGVIARGADGKCDLFDAVQSFVKHQRAERQEAGGGTRGSTPYTTARARLTSARADVAEMKQKQMAGELVPADKIEQAWTAAAMNMRTRLLALPTRAAPRVVAAKTAAGAEEILRTLVCEALNELANAEVATARQPI